MEWHILRTGRVWVDPGGPFGLVPKSLWKRTLTPNSDNLVPMDLNCLLIYSDGKTIVVDTGLGDKLSPKAAKNWGIEYPHGTMADNLKKFGVAREDVDIVIDTHLHSDHCGGNTTIKDGKVVPTFPNATYYVQYIEWADAMNTDERTRGTYLANNFLPLWQQGKFKFLYGDTAITSDVKCVATRGHTRGHQSVILEDGKSHIFYLADLATYSVHFARVGWVTAYDVEPLETISSKKIWQSWAIKNDATLVFEHDTLTALGKLHLNADGKISIRSLD